MDNSVKSKIFLPNLFESKRCENCNTLLLHTNVEITPKTNKRTLTERDVDKKFSMPPLYEKGFKKIIEKSKKLFLKKLVSCSLINWLQLLPIIQTIKQYTPSYLAGDILCGISEGIMAIPMGMSYALLARMPPQYGIYNGLMQPLIYMLFGTSPHVSVGVSSIENLLTAEVVHKFLRGYYPNGIPDEIRWETTIALSLCVGFTQLLLAVLGFGTLSSFLADSVLSAFATASVFVIATSQLKYAFDLEAPLSVSNSEIAVNPKTWWYYITNLHNIGWVAVVITVISVCFLVALKKINTKWFPKVPLPSTLILLLVSTCIFYVAELDVLWGVNVVGDIPSGFPLPAIPSFSIQRTEILAGEVVIIEEQLFADLMVRAIPLAIMLYVIHISIAKSFAQLHGTYSVRYSQELAAIGLSNIGSGFFRCFPCATSISRSSLLSQFGVQTILHNIPYVCVMALTLWLLTPFLYYIPYPVLASIIFVGVYGMLKFKDGINIIKMGGLDCLLWIVTFVVTIVIGTMEGITISLILSLLWLLKESSRPTTAILGNFPGSTVYRNIKRFPMAVQIPGICIFRFDASLSFCNAEYFEKKIHDIRLKGLYIFIIDGSSINRLDVTAIRMLQKVELYLRSHGIMLLLANWIGPMRDFLEKMKFYEIVPLERCFLSLHDAVCWSKYNLKSMREDLNDEFDGVLEVSRGLNIMHTFEGCTIEKLETPRWKCENEWSWLHDDEGGVLQLGGKQNGVERLKKRCKTINGRLNGWRDEQMPSMNSAVDETPPVGVCTSKSACEDANVGRL